MFVGEKRPHVDQEVIITTNPPCAGFPEGTSGITHTFPVNPSNGRIFKPREENPGSGVLTFTSMRPQVDFKDNPTPVQRDYKQAQDLILICSFVTPSLKIFSVRIHLILESVHVHVQDTMTSSPGSTGN